VSVGKGTRLDGGDFLKDTVNTGTVQRKLKLRTHEMKSGPIRDLGVCVLRI
jgi:hypothetical protein